MKDKLLYPPCGAAVFVKSKETNEDGSVRMKLLGFCERPIGHSQPCTHVMSAYSAIRRLRWR